jgi:hypothetical protein
MPLVWRYGRQAVCPPELAVLDYAAGWSSRQLKRQAIRL